MLLGLLVLFIGVNLIAHPLCGLISITYAVAVVMMIVGIVRLVLAFSDELRPFRLIMVISGALSIILAMMIFFNFPHSAAVVLGFYLAIELISNGVKGDSGPRCLLVNLHKNKRWRCPNRRS